MIKQNVVSVIKSYGTVKYIEHNNDDLDEAEKFVRSIFSNL